MVRQKSDMTSYIKFIHKEAEPVIISSLLDKCFYQIKKLRIV